MASCTQHKDDGVEPWQELVVLVKGRRCFGALRGSEGKIEVQCEGPWKYCGTIGSKDMGNLDPWILLLTVEFGISST